MKVGYFGDGPWSHLALQRIVGDDRFAIAFIAPRFDSQDPVLRGWAERLGVDFLPLRDVNAPEAVKALAGYEADIFVSMSFNQIFKAQILALPPCGIINCHAGSLPFYRGRNILNWALINDAREFGVTVHYVDGGIDTGDVILEQRGPIADSDTYQTLLDRAVVMCADTLHEALVGLDAGTAARIPQSSIHPVGFYCGRRVVGDEWVDWTWTSRRVFNFVRAIGEPGPGARTATEQGEIVIAAATLIPAAPDYLGTPGEVVGLRPDAVVVKTGDSTISVTLVQGGDRPTLRIGTRLKSRSEFQIQSLRRRLDELQEQVNGLEPRLGSVR